MTTESRWELADRVLVRMAGFPISWLMRMQSRPAADSARRVLALERELRERQRQTLDLLAACRRTADTGPEEGEAAAGSAVRVARRAERFVRRLRPVPLEGLPAQCAAGLLEWNDAAHRRERAIAAGTEAWTGEIARAEEVLRGIAAAAGFQEAVFLNSPGAFARIRDYAAGARSAKVRRLAVRYLQRFCVKVETGGFYGPVNYGQFVPGSPDPLGLEPRGDGRAGRRHTLLSYWAAQQIASAWARDERLTGLLRLYRAARGDAGSGPAPDPALLALATGEHTLESAGQQLDVPLDILHAAVLDAQSRSWLRIGIRVPATVGDPLAALRGLVEDSATAARAGLPDQLSMVDRLLSEFEQADLPGRERLLAEGNELIVELTGAQPARGAGSFYADRFWYTEEATGNLGPVTFGQPVAAKLAGALAPALEILASSAVGEREAQQESMRELLASAGGVIGAEQLLDMADPEPGDSPATWSVEPLTGAPQLELTPDEARDLGLIRADLDRWPLFCAPDVMLVARDREQLSGTDWQVVLSEAHHICPPTQLPFAAFDPDPAGMRADTWAAIESLTGTAQPLLQGINRQNKTRDYTPIGHDVLWLDWHGAEPGARGVRIADCRVEEGPDGRPSLRDSGGRELALFPEYDDAHPDTRMLRAVSLPGMDKQPVRLSTMTPRMVIGSLVYQRQRWDLTAGDLPCWQVPAGSFAEYLAAWRWKTEWTMPDQVFARLPGEEKPMFLDFCSPLSVDTFLRAANGCDRLGLDEMLPGFDQLWLEIAGERYCCELRLTAFRNSGARPR